MSIPANFIPFMNFEYDNPFILEAALILAIHNLLKSLFFNLLPTYAFLNALITVSLAVLNNLLFPP